MWNPAAQAEPFEPEFGALAIPLKSSVQAVYLLASLAGAV